MNWETTFILGGGPSARDFDTAALASPVIGVNDAAFHKPCSVFFTNDHGWALSARPLIEGFPGTRHLNVRHRHKQQFDGWDARIWTRVESSIPPMDGETLSSGPSGTPGCSGYVALNLAAQLGAKTIVLIGYDFQSTYTYFFNEEPYPRVRIPEVVASFKQIAPWYAKKGIRILNANPGSAIDAFPKITHEEACAIDEEGSCRHDRETGAGSLIAGMA